MRDGVTRRAATPSSERDGEPRGAASVPVRDRVPHARLGRRGRGRRAGGVPALPRRRGRGRVAEGLPRDRHHAARDRRAALRPSAARGVPGRVAARAARRGRGGPARRDGRLALAPVPAPAGEALARRARGLPPAGGLRLPLRRTRPDRRQEPRELPPDPRPGTSARRRGAAPLRRLTRGARGGRSPVRGGVGGRRRRRARRAARAGRDGVRRRRRQGAGDAAAARRRGARGEGADRLGAAGARARHRAIAGPSSTASPASSSTTRTGRRAGSPGSRSRTGSSSPCGRSSTRTSSGTCGRRRASRADRVAAVRPCRVSRSGRGRP